MKNDTEVLSMQPRRELPRGLVTGWFIPARCGCSVQLLTIKELTSGTCTDCSLWRLNESETLAEVNARRGFPVEGGTA